MKILWITNSIMPELAAQLNLSVFDKCGWLHASANQLKKSGDVNLAIATVHNCDHLEIIEINDITYFLIPSDKSQNAYHSEWEKYWIKIKEYWEPEVIHIHGTEYALGLSYLKSCGNTGVVVSIQGLVSVYYRYFYGGLSLWDIVRNITFRDIIRDSLISQRSSFRHRGKFEKEYIERTRHIIGRTSWDKDHTWAINPDVMYHFCNETLRPSFYNNIWDINKCTPHSVVVGQAGYPLKGFHKVLDAMPLILRNYPDCKVFVPGDNIISRDSFIKKLKFTGYGKFILRKIRELGLQNNIHFTGKLNECEMCSLLLKANVFVCPSSIENSPNTLGEAQLLGVPSVASYVGGNMDFIENGDSGLLYRFDEYEMLARRVCNIFSDEELACRLSLNARKAAFVRHDSNENLNQLLSIYSNVIVSDY